MDLDERRTYNLCDALSKIDDDFTLLSKFWHKFKKFLTEENLNNCITVYKSSDIECSYIKAAYLSGRGCTSYIIGEVQFMIFNDEPCVQIIVRELINANEVPEFARKHNDLENNYEGQAKEAEQIQKEFAPQDSAQQLFENLTKVICKSEKFKQMIRMYKEKRAVFGFISK